MIQLNVWYIVMKFCEVFKDDNLGKKLSGVVYVDEFFFVVNILSDLRFVRVKKDYENE